VSTWWEEQGEIPHPRFFVSVASKGFRIGVSLLIATLTGRFVNVADKGLMGAGCWRESNGLGWRDSEGVRGRIVCMLEGLQVGKRTKKRGWFWVGAGWAGMGFDIHGRG
jgi:hypothetical protein